MKDEEKGFRVSLERLRILAGRLKKVLKAKNDLLYIFKVLLQFQKNHPIIKRELKQSDLSNESKEYLMSQALKLKNLVV